MRTLALTLLLFPSPVLAEAHLVVSAEGDVRILVDDQDVGALIHQGPVPVVVGQPGRHALRVESHGGSLRAEQSVDLADGETLLVHWDGTRLSVTPQRDRRPSSTTGQSYSQPSTVQAAQAGTAVAGLLAPANPVVGTVATGLSVVSAGGTLARTAQSALDASARHSSVPHATSAHEDHSLDSLQQSDFDPYAAAGGRPAFDASLASVTFVAAPGTQALVTIDSQPVATLEQGASEATLALAPGMHKVMIFDATGVELMHRGYLTVTAGWVLELRFSVTEPPTCSLPEAWR